MKKCRILTKFISAGLIVILIFSTMTLSGCSQSKYLYSVADIEKTFLKDYDELKRVADYLLSLDDSVIIIQYNKNSIINRVEVDYGKGKIENKEIKDIVRNLFKEGYLSINKSDTTVTYERWEEKLSPEFRGGFAFTDSGVLDVQYMIYQTELSISNWYYYEEDYNEWRVDQN